MIEAAALVHKDFGEKFKFAGLYRLRGEPSGLMVDRAHVVEDKNIVAFHI